MFSLIITVIAIALTAILAVASVYYGGTTFNDQSASAQAAQMANEGEQVKAAALLYQTTQGSAAADLQALINTNYLVAAPQGWQLMDGFAAKTGNTQNACLSANQKVGVNLIPTCADYQSNPAYAGKALCCEY